MLKQKKQSSQLISDNQPTNINTMKAYIGHLQEALRHEKIMLEELTTKIKRELSDSISKEDFEAEELKNKPQRDEMDKLVKEQIANQSESEKELIKEQQIRIFVAMDYKWKEKNVFKIFDDASINSSEKLVNGLIRKGEQAFGELKFALYREKIEFAFDNIKGCQHDLMVAREERDKARERKNYTFEQLKKVDPIFEGKLWKVAEEYETDYIKQFVKSCEYIFTARAIKREKETGKIQRAWSDKDEATAIEMAKMEILRYVYKLSRKIGKEVKTAKLTGDLWSYSTLEVECEDGEKQIWNTHQITNYSCYGRPFTQWPTRKGEPCVHNVNFNKWD